MSAVPDTHRAIDAVWRIESARLIAGLARIVRDVGLAEDLAQEALVAALEQWPEAGIPDNPGAWLMATAKHRAIDGIRHEQMADRKREEIAREMDVIHEPDLDAQADDDIGDDLLTLIFTACHPVLNTEARIALTLRLVGALTTPEIARAFVVPEKTMAQRIVRAKKTLKTAGVSFETPHGDERDERLASVLEVVYAIFNEGYSATAGDDWMRPALTEDALRLGRILAGLAAGRGRGARPDGADGDPGLTRQGAHRRRRRADPAAGPGPLALGPAADPARARRRSSARRTWPRAAPARTRCRRPSPPATPAHASPTTPTGTGSPCCTPTWPAAPGRRWWS